MSDLVVFPAYSAFGMRLARPRDHPMLSNTGIGTLPSHRSPGNQSGGMILKDVHLFAPYTKQFNFSVDFLRHDVFCLRWYASEPRSSSQAWACRRDKLLESE
jgi:hypothetical protein